jgi:hypothetical protein
LTTLTTPDKINLAIAIATGFSALVSLAMVIVTYFIVRANRDTVEAMRAQIEAASRPYIQIVPVVRPMTTAIELRISNSGTTPAKNLRLSLDQDFHFNAETGEHNNLRSYSAFREAIQMLPPRAELRYLLGIGHKILLNEPLCPTRFTITATYEYGTKSLSESTTIDLEPYKKSGAPIDVVAEQIQRLSNEVREISSLLRNRAD